MSTWTGHKNEALIEEFIDVCRRHCADRKEVRPKGWVLRRSVTAYETLIGRRGSGANLSHEVSREIGFHKGRGGEYQSGGRVEAVVVGLMAWPDSLPVYMKMTSRERNALLKIAAPESDVSHQLALAALYNRIMLRSRK